MFENLIDKKISEGSGLRIGDTLRQIDEDVDLISRVIGFDSDGCPFVRYTYVYYKSKEAKPHDPIEIGDVLPFPWSDPVEYKVT